MVRGLFHPFVLDVRVPSAILSRSLMLMLVLVLVLAPVVPVAAAFAVPVAASHVMLGARTAALNCAWQSQMRHVPLRLPILSDRVQFSDSR